MTGADRRYFKQLRDAYAGDLKRMQDQKQKLEIALHEIERGLRHIDSALAGEGLAEIGERVEAEIASAK